MHKGCINLNLSILHIYMLHKVRLVVIYMYRGPLEHITLVFIWYGH